MLHLKTLTMRNFMSVGNVTQAINLANDGLTLVLGENLDATQGENSARNGAGKTTVLNAISYGLFGKPMTQIKLPNLINKTNGKNMLVTIEFDCKGHSYRILRGKKPDLFQYIVDGVEVGSRNEAQGENRDTQPEIERLIAIDPVMFKYIIALNTYTEPFLKMSASKQREVIEKLLGYTALSEKADVLREFIRRSKQDIENEQFRVKTINDTNDRIQKAINDLNLKIAQWNRHHEGEIERLENALKDFAHVDFEAELRIFDEIEQYDQISKELTDHLREVRRDFVSLEDEVYRLINEAKQYETNGLNGNNTEEKRLLSDIERYQTEKAAIAQRLAGLETQQDALRQSLESPGDLTCKTCNQPLRDTDHAKYVIRRMTEDLAELGQQADELRSQQGHLDKSIKTVREAIEASRIAADEKKAQLSQKAQETRLASQQKADVLLERQHHIDSKQAALEQLGPRPVSIFGNRDEVWIAKNEIEKLTHQLEGERNSTNPYGDQIAALRATLQEVSYERLNSLARLREHQEFLLKLLTDKNSFIRKKIIDQNLAYLNFRLAYHLGQIGLPHEVKFRNDLSVEITELGRDYDYDNLSRGEQNRLIIGLSLAFRDIFENLNMPINLLMVDELIDSGMDTQGVETSLEVLKTIGRERGKNIFLISHREELMGRVSDILMVTKHNGFTTFASGQE